jgi:hypothetical protein
LHALFDANPTFRDEVHAVAGVALGEDGLIIAVNFLFQSGSKARTRIAIQLLENRDLS